MHFSKANTERTEETKGDTCFSRGKDPDGRRIEGLVVSAPHPKQPKEHVDYLCSVQFEFEV